MSLIVVLSSQTTYNLAITLNKTLQESQAEVVTDIDFNAEAKVTAPQPDVNLSCKITPQLKLTNKWQIGAQIDGILAQKNQAIQKHAFIVSPNEWRVEIGQGSSPVGKLLPK